MDFEAELGPKIESLFRRFIGDKNTEIQIKAIISDFLSQRELTLNEAEKIEKALDKTLDILLSTERSKIYKKIEESLDAHDRHFQAHVKAEAELVLNNKLRGILERALGPYMTKAEIEDFFNNKLRDVLSRLLEKYATKEQVAEIIERKLGDKIQAGVFSERAYEQTSAIVEATVDQKLLEREQAASIKKEQVQEKKEKKISNRVIVICAIATVVINIAFLLVQIYL